MARYCPECGAQLRPGARFCVSCGTPAPTSPQPEVVAEGETAPRTFPPQRPGAPGEAAREPEATAPMEPVTPPAPTPTVPAPVRPGAHGARPAGSARHDALADQFSAWPDHEQPTQWSPPQGTPVAAAPPPYPPHAVPAGVPAGVPASSMGGFPSVAPGQEQQPLGQAGTGPRRTPAWPAMLVLVVLVVGGLLWAFLVLRPGGGGGPGAAGTTVTSDSPSATGGSSTTTDAAAAPQRARSAVGTILDAGRGSRATLVQGIDTYCSKRDRTAGRKLMNDALQGRTQQLAKLNEVGDDPFRDVAGALAARDKLKAALQASAEVDQVYLRMAEAGTVCAGSAELTQANAKASAGKAAFLAAWNPLMAKATLPSLKEDDI